MFMSFRISFTVVAFLAACLFGSLRESAGEERAENKAPGVVDAGSIRGKILCGYQGWFRAPGDRADMGWVHWSRDGRRVAPETLTFEMWPDMTDYPENERFAVPGFSDTDGNPSTLFSSDQPGTVRRHFEWMRDYGIDGVWLQHFVVDLQGGPLGKRYASRRRVLDDVRAAAQKTGRIWALTFDISGMPVDRLYDVLTAEWKKLVDEGISKDDRYLHESGKPVVEFWGLYQRSGNTKIDAALATRLIDFFKEPGPYQAYVVGGGDWNWRRNRDSEWEKVYRRCDAVSPWNVGNAGKNASGEVKATTSYWAEDKAECEKLGILWLPVVYPGFSWDNLQKRPPGSTIMPRRGGKFYWEQFHALSKLGVDTVKVAMFDEVDEGTAIFKVSNQPPTQAHFVTLDGLPTDWYLRLTGEATRLLRAKQPVPEEIPISSEKR